MPTPTDDQKTRLQETIIDRKSDDARERLVKGHTDAKTVNLQDRTVDGIASTINIDRDGEIVLPSALKATLVPFLASSAPFLAAHTHRTSTAEPSQIGWVMAGDIKPTRVVCTFRFVNSPIADQWWALVSDPEGKGIAFSIGFRPERSVYGSVADLVRAYPELKPIFAAAGLNPDDRLRVLTEIELLEISAVPVPANREALQLAAAKALAKGMGLDPETGEAQETAQAVKDLTELMVQTFKDAGEWVTPKQLDEKIADAMGEFQRTIDDRLGEVVAIIPDDVNADGQSSGASRSAGDDGGDDGTSEAQRHAGGVPSQRLRTASDKLGRAATADD